MCSSDLRGDRVPLSPGVVRGERRRHPGPRPSLTSRRAFGSPCSVIGRRSSEPTTDNEKRHPKGRRFSCGSPDQIRTGVTGLRGRRPRPLDDGAVGCDRSGDRLGGEDSNPQWLDQNQLCCQLHHPRTGSEGYRIPSAVQTPYSGRAVSRMRASTTSAPSWPVARATIVPSAPIIAQPGNAPMP